jgi:hypothetical protein
MTDKLKLFIKEKLTFEEQNQLLSYVDDGDIDGINKFITDYSLLTEFQSILAEMVRNNDLEFTSKYKFWTILSHHSSAPMAPGVMFKEDKLELTTWGRAHRGYVLFKIEDLLKFIKTDVNNEIFKDDRYIRPFYIGNDIDAERHEWNGITFYVTEPNDQKLDYQYGNRIQWDEDNLVSAIKYCFKMAIQIITRDAVTVNCKIKAIDVKKRTGKYPSWRATVHYKLTGESITQRTEEEWPSVEFTLPSTKLNKTSLLEDCCKYVINSINTNYSIVPDTKIEREKNNLKKMIKEEYNKIGISNVGVSDAGDMVDVNHIKLIENGIQYGIKYNIEAQLVDEERLEKIDNVDLLIKRDLTPSTSYYRIEKSLDDNRRECQLVCAEIAKQKKVVTDELNSKYEEILSNYISKKNEIAELTTKLQEKIPDLTVGIRIESTYGSYNGCRYNYMLTITLESSLIKNGSYVVEYPLSSNLYADELYARILRKRIPQKTVNRKSTSIKGTEDKLFTFGDEGEDI